MGGSLGLALRRRAGVRVTAYARRPETRRLALKAGAAEAIFETPQAAARGADIAVFCTPVLAIPGLVTECRPSLSKGCVITDVGSTKADLARAMTALLPDHGAVFVGSHPMAGSEKTGMEAARPDLYDGAVTAVTPDAGVPETAVAAVCELWRGVGARVVRIAPDAHDLLVARTSHLPHLMAALLVAVAGREMSAELKEFVGPGFRDTTRVASGSPEMWHDIVKTNRAAVLKELRACEGAMRDLIGKIEAGDFEGVKEWLEACGRRRSELVRQNL
jgi:prephenate dehydrogenase